jgi:peroxiredoxin
MQHSGSALLIALISAAACGCEEGSGKGANSADAKDHPLLGAQAPEFELPSQAGDGKVSLDANSGKIVVVDFWATWCEPCRESFPAYEHMMKQHDDLVVLGVSVDEEPDGIPRFIADTKVHFPIGWDRDQHVSKLYKPPAMPTSYMIDTNGIVRHVHAGYHEGDDAIIAKQVGSLAE